MRFEAAVPVPQGVAGPDPVAAPGSVNDETQILKLTRRQSDSDTLGKRILLALEGGAATSAIVTGTPFVASGLVGGEQISIDLDNAGPVVVTFLVTDQTPTEVAAQINAALPGSPVTVVDGALVITSPTTGVTSEIDLVDTTPGTLAAIGLVVGVTNGLATETVTLELWALNEATDPNADAITPAQLAARKFYRFATGLVLTSSILAEVTAAVPPGGKVYARVTATTILAGQTRTLRASCVS